MEISEDNANSWWITDKIPQDDARFRTIQPTILVHKDGRLQLLARTAAPKTPEQKDDALVATSWSDDGGLTWSQMEFISDLPNNNSGIDAVTLPDGTFAVVYNPFGCVDWRKSDDPKRNKPLRTPLWVATSKDGIHWTPTRQLETSPIGQYSYPTMIVGSDGTLHCVYTWRRERIKYKRFEIH
jgi:alpha-L-rhamnosidase